MVAKGLADGAICSISLQSITDSFTELPLFGFYPEQFLEVVGLQFLVCIHEIEDCLFLLQGYMQNVVNFVLDDDVVDAFPYFANLEQR